MRRYAVIGWPVGHSLSPAMQNAAFKARGIDALYEAVPIDPEEFHTGIRRLLDEGFDGWNVTVPHKERMFEACDALGNGDARASPFPRASQASNILSLCGTVTFQPSNPSSRRRRIPVWNSSGSIGTAS